MSDPKTTDLAGAALREARGASSKHAALFERVSERIYRYFAKTIWDAGEAEELAQRTLFELERSLREGTYDPARSFNAWMWLKAHTAYAQWCREREKRGEPLETAAEVAAPGPGPAAEVEERLDAETVLREVQRRLGRESYEVLVLYYEGGLTQAEVAEAIDRDRKTVAARLREAHLLIDELLKQQRRSD